MGKRLLAIIISVSLAGCSQTTYVPHGTPVRLRETVKKVKVWVKNSDGRPVAGEMDIPEGWYALPLEEGN